MSCLTAHCKITKSGALRSVWEEECKRYLLKKQKAHYTQEKIKQELDKSSEDID